MAAFKRIDAHHHFWKYKPELFPWITEELSVVARDFLPEEFEQVIKTSGIDSTVAIHNFRSLEETDTFLTYAEKFSWISAVVGWFPLVSDDVSNIVSEYAKNPWIVGARDILQFPEVSPYFEKPAFHRGLKAVANFGLTYDLLIGPWQIEPCIQLVDAHPDLQFILSHLGKPPIASGDIGAWETSFIEISKRSNVVCKLSGLPLEANFPDWKEHDITPCIQLALDCFGPSRLMFGSDWPPCLMATSYQAWFNLVEKSLSSLSIDEQAQIWSGTATQIYGLSS
ncbi:MAG: amidohydrolase family protein [Verrucomicrobiota bacterium]